MFDSRQRILQIATALSLLVVGVAAVQTGAGDALGPRNVDAARVVATPLPTPVPPPTPTPYPRTSEHVACPQLDNPGGGLQWVPSADAGPWQTGGSVEIPAVGETARIVRVGIASNSEMVTPRNAKDVAWLDQGGFPGRTQNAVLAGHINYSRVPGTFRNIKNLGPGDRVFVNLDGARWEFAVTWVCTFDPSTNLAEQIMGYTNVPSITLVTCGGTFDRRLGTHNRRTVVRAELVASA